jgi:hypothetical protein
MSRRSVIACLLVAGCTGGVAASVTASADVKHNNTVCIQTAHDQDYKNAQYICVTIPTPDPPPGS